MAVGSRGVGKIRSQSGECKQEAIFGEQRDQKFKFWLIFIIVLAYDVDL